MRINRMIRAGLAVAFVVSVGACGSGGDDPAQVASVGDGRKTADSGDEAKGSTDPEEAALEFARCMRKQGIDFPDPKTDGNGRIQMGPGPGAGFGADDDELEAAHEKCKHLLPDGGALGGDLTPEQKAEIQDQMVKFAKCMREHGVDMPDPDPDSGGIVVHRDDTSGPDPRSKEFQAAEEACRDLLRPPGGGEVVREDGGDR